MNLSVTGKLKRFLPQQTGTKKDGSGQWVKQSFLVDSETQYNNIYCFEVFGDEKVANLTKHQSEGDTVTVEFNVNTNEHNGNYYTTLSAWKIIKVEANQGNAQPQSNQEPAHLGAENEENLPF